MSALLKTSLWLAPLSPAPPHPRESLLINPDGQGMQAVLLPMDRDMFASSWFIEHRVEARALDGGQIAERYSNPVLTP